MRLLIYQDKINQDNETINSTSLEILSNHSSKTDKEEKVSYTYVGQLSIPTIGLKRGFVAKNSKYNNINYNIEIAKEAAYPDVKKGNFILLAHSGDAAISFFDKLYQLTLGDEALVSYDAKTYRYRLVKMYELPKTGKIALYRNYQKKTLSLITCTHQNDQKQSIYIFEEDEG